MKFKAPKLNNIQIQELSKVLLDIGKAIFLGSVATYFIPALTDREIPVTSALTGLFCSLTFILIGIILLSKEKRK